MFSDGDIVYNKVTDEQCVILARVNTQEYAVRTEKNIQVKYFEHELISELDWKEKNNNDFGPSFRDDPGFGV